MNREMSDEQMQAYYNSLPDEPELTEHPPELDEHGKAIPIRSGFTVQGMIEAIAQVLKGQPSLGEVPVYMYSDEEGNSTHKLWDLFFSMADDDTVEALVLQPGGRVGGW